MGVGKGREGGRWGRKLAWVLDMALCCGIGKGRGEGGRVGWFGWEPRSVGRDSLGVAA